MLQEWLHFLTMDPPVSGVTTVEQYITSQQWHLISPPVSGATINTYFDIYLKEYNEPSDTWTYLVTPTSTPMNFSKGYSAWASVLIYGYNNRFF